MSEDSHWASIVTDGFPFLLSRALYLRPDSNEITGSIPSEIGELKSISNLVVDGNFLTGSLPTTIGSLEKLNYFGLGKFAMLYFFTPFQRPNFFTETVLLVIGAAYNSITGPIPTELGKIDTLEHIVFGKNLVEFDRRQSSQIEANYLICL